jgi:geranylgeranyl diphosphate synthase, type II
MIPTMEVVGQDQIRQLLESAELHYTENNAESAMLQPVNYLMSLGGKRVRPFALAASYAMFRPDVEAAIQPALAVEVFHNFTLMHDDIMDKSPLRRGKPTVHEKWSTNTAILSGDAMMIQAYNLLIKTHPDCLMELLESFNKTALEVCHGQQQDMDFEQRDDVTVSEYMEMIRLKTSVLLAGACEMGGIIAGADKTNREALYAFGLHLGLQFQLWDDYLDTFGQQAKVGKELGTDILNDKKTFLLIRTMQNADDERLRELKSYQGYPTEPSRKAEKIQRVRAWIERYGAIDELNRLCDEHYQKALSALDSINRPEESKALLRQMAMDLYKRDH